MSYGRPPPRTESMISLKVDNITYRTTSEDLRRIFERYGEVGDVYIPRDRFTRESRGFAFVRFIYKKDAEDALKAMDGRELNGRELHVDMARYGRPPSPHRRYQGRRRYRGRRSRSSSYHSRSSSRSRSRSRKRRSVSRRSSRSDSEKSRSRSRTQSAPSTSPSRSLGL